MKGYIVHVSTHSLLGPTIGTERKKAGEGKKLDASNIMQLLGIR
jgi:hypothetical protein